MYPNSIYFGLKAVPIAVLWGQSIYYLGAWTLRVPLALCFLVCGFWGWVDVSGLRLCGQNLLEGLCPLIRLSGCKSLSAFSETFAHLGTQTAVSFRQHFRA